MTKAEREQMGIPMPKKKPYLLLLHKETGKPISIAVLFKSAMEKVTGITATGKVTVDGKELDVYAIRPGSRRAKEKGFLPG